MSDLTPFRLPKRLLADGVVRLRRLDARDAAAIAAACRDPLIPRFTYMPSRLTRAGALAWIARRDTQWAEGLVATFAITTTQTDDLVGIIGLAPDWRRRSGEVFYLVANSARQKGIATRAVRLVATWAFRVVHLKRLEVITHPDNVASQRVARSAGFTYEGTLRSHQPFKGRRMDSVLLSRLPNDPPVK